MHYRTADLEDLPLITKLYKTVAQQQGGIARNVDEVTDEYVQGFISKSVERGLIIVGTHPDAPEELVAEIHAYRSGLKVFDHVLTDLTLVVHPEYQQKKSVGQSLQSSSKKLVEICPTLDAWS